MSTYSSYSDEQLIAYLGNSDQEAFTEIYRRYWKLLLSIAGNKLPSIADAEEVVQEVFADLWKRRAEVSIKYSLKSFLAAAAKYQVYSAMARLNKERTLALPGEIHQPSVSINEDIEARNLFAKLYDKASSLPERCFLIYKLSRIDGLNNKEISANLGISEKTIESQLTRALRHLRTAMHLAVLGIYLF